MADENLPNPDGILPVAPRSNQVIAFSSEAIAGGAPPSPAQPPDDLARSMNENSDIRLIRLPISVKLLLIYQWIVAVICIGYGGLYTYVLFDILSHEGANENLKNMTDWQSSYGNLLVIACAILVLFGFGAAMIFASIGIARRNPQGFLVGMICHLILEIVALPTCVTLFVVGILTVSGYGVLLLLFALGWSPFVLISGWAFFCLRRLGKRVG